MKMGTELLANILFNKIVSYEDIISGKVWIIIILIYLGVKESV
jgi:hypothetical protein